jgi:hypothetical protein
MEAESGGAPSIVESPWEELVSQLAQQVEVSAKSLTLCSRWFIEHLRFTQQELTGMLESSRHDAVNAKLKAEELLMEKAALTAALGEAEHIRQRAGELESAGEGTA